MYIKKEAVCHDSKTKKTLFLYRTLRYYLAWYYSLLITVGLPLILYYAVIANIMVLYFSFLLSIVSFVATRFIIRYRIRNISIHKKSVRVVQKEKVEESYGRRRGEKYVVYAQVFEAPDASKEMIRIPRELIRPKENFDGIATNDTGLLLCEERKNKRFFIGFERDDGMNFYVSEYYKHVISPNIKNESN